MRGIAIMLCVSLPLVAADLYVKATEPTPDWAYHDRSLGWLALSIALFGGMLVIARIPSLSIGFLACTEEKPLYQTKSPVQILLKPQTHGLFKRIALLSPVSQPVAFLFHRQANSGKGPYHVALLDVAELSQATASPQGSVPQY